jgi:hypothetical protein
MTYFAGDPAPLLAANPLNSNTPNEPNPIFGHSMSKLSAQRVCDEPPSLAPTRARC